MTTALPPGITSGTVHYAAIAGIVDSVADADAEPDRIPVTGKILFSPISNGPQPVDEDGVKLHFYPTDMQFDVKNVNGTGRLVDDTGRIGVRLPSNDLNRTAKGPVWRWTATFLLTGVRQVPTLAPFDLGANQALNLRDVVPPSTSIQPPILRGPSAYEVAVANGFSGTEKQWLDSIGSGRFAFGPTRPANPSVGTVYIPTPA